MHDCVISGLTIDLIIATQRVDRIIATAGKNFVVTRGTRDVVITIAGGDVFDRSVQGRPTGPANRNSGLQINRDVVINGNGVEPVSPAIGVTDGVAPAVHVLQRREIVRERVNVIRRQRRTEERNVDIVDGAGRGAI